MSLPAIIKKHINRLGGEIVDQVKIDLSGKLERVDFEKLPDSYKQLLFGVKWPDTDYFLLSDIDLDDLDDMDWNVEEWEEEVDSDELLKIEHWDYVTYNDPDHVLTYEMGPESNMNSDYIQIAGDGNYVYLIDLLDIQTDGDPIVHKVHLYEDKDENIYFTKKYSDFIQGFYKDNVNEVIDYLKANYDL